MSDRHDQLVNQAKRAIDAVFTDTSVPQTTTRDSLLKLIRECQNCIDHLEIDDEDNDDEDNSMEREEEISARAYSILQCQQVEEAACSLRKAVRRGNDWRQQANSANSQIDQALANLRALHLAMEQARLEGKSFRLTSSFQLGAGDADA